jgi:acetylornithine deacetylase/succinyl-diaminopimelate desuccinylase-like protein
LTVPDPADGRSDTSGVEASVVALLSTMIRFDTTNWGRGRSRGERPLAEWIAARLREAGWHPRVLARPDGPDRANVVVRVPGRDEAAPGVLVHVHLDVVPVEPAHWSLDPFGGLVRDGYVYGRGARDMKDMVAAVLATLLTWGRTGMRPRRDVVVAFVADEEDRGEFGAEWLVDEHPELFAGVEVAIGESGGEFTLIEPVSQARGRPPARCYPVAAAERGTMHVRLTATGTAGHGSRPAPDNPVVRLVDALHRLAHEPWPLHLGEVVRAQLVALSDAAGLQPDLDSPAGIDDCVAALGERADQVRHTVRASSTPTVIEAGYKVNVVPGVASAEVDVRCPPGFDAELRARLPELIGPDVGYEFLALQPPVSAPLDGPWFAAIAAALRRGDPEALVIPVCLTGGTDAKAFSRLGLACYGFDPLGEDPDGRRAAGTHGVDERVPVASLIWGAAVLQDLLTTI